MTRANTPEQIWRRIQIGEADECWPWTGKVNNSGYGIFTASGEARGAHVWAYKLANGGVVPDRVLHTCDNRRCCNPKHLFAGTSSDNAKDCWNKGRNFYQQNPNARPKGANHANAKLTDAQVADIITSYATGKVRQVDLAAKYKVSQRVISLIVRRESYK